MKRVVSIALLILIASCGDSTAETIIFGEGDIPPAIPSDFPLPTDAVIGATLVDTVNTKSEFEFRTATDMAPLVQAMSVGLVELGYVVESSSGDTVQWAIGFRRNGLEGSIQFRSFGPGAAQGVVRVNDT